MSKCTLTIETIYHIKDGAEHGPVEYVEQTIYDDGVLVYSRKTTTEKWLREKSPLRDLERWLFGHETRNRSNIANKIKNALEGYRLQRSFRRRFCKFLYFELKLLHLRVQLLLIKIKDVKISLKSTFRQKVNGIKPGNKCNFHSPGA